LLEGELQDLGKENRDLVNQYSKLQLALDDFDEEAAYPAFTF
jgi:hypothetical protein